MQQAQCDSSIRQTVVEDSGIIPQMSLQDKALSMRKLMAGAPPLDADKGKALFWVPGGMDLMLHVEGAIAAALRLRGADVHAVICDGAYRACVRREYNQGVPVKEWANLCKECPKHTAAALDALQVPYSFVGDFVSEARRTELWEMSDGFTWDDLDTFEYKGVPVGKNIQSGIIRYMQGHDYDGDRDVMQEYVYSGILSCEATHVALERHSPDRVYLSHGVYVDWGPTLHTALKMNLPITAWMGSYLKCHFFFQNIKKLQGIDFHYIRPELWESLKREEFTSEQDAQLSRFFENRYNKGLHSDMKEIEKSSTNIQEFRAKYGPDPDKPIWGVMSHINWDATNEFAPKAYGSLNEWILETVREVSEIKDVQWVVKVHPAEQWFNPDTGVQALIQKHFPNLPDNVRVMPMHETISPHDFYAMVDGGVTIFGTGGLEMSLQGKPVILAGEAYYGDKGFTYEGVTRNSYVALLKQAAQIGPLSEDQILLAKKFAYVNCIRRQIPFEVVYDRDNEYYSFQHDKKEMLVPGANPFVDFICEKIISGEEFIMDDELTCEAEAATRRMFKL